MRVNERCSTLHRAGMLHVLVCLGVHEGEGKAGHPRRRSALLTCSCRRDDARRVCDAASRGRRLVDASLLLLLMPPFLEVPVLVPAPKRAAKGSAKTASIFE